MKFKIIIFVLIINSLLFIHASAQQKIRIVKYGEPISFQFEYTDPILEAYGSTATYQLLVYKGPFSKPTAVEMEFSQDYWRAVYTETDTSVKVLFFSYQSTDRIGNVKNLQLNKDDYQQVLMGSSPDLPRQGAYQGLAVSYTGAGEIKRRNPAKALKAIAQELVNYPDNLDARRLQYTLMLKETADRKRTRKRIERDIENLIIKNPNSIKTLRFAVSSLKMIGEKDKAAQITDTIIEHFPRSNVAAENRFKGIMKIEDTGSRATQLDEFLEEYKNPTWTEYALTALANTDIELDDQANMIKTGDRLLIAATTPGSAGALAGLAGVLSESNFHQDKAEQYAMRAIELIQQAAEMAAPPGMSKPEWQEQLISTEARYLDILGWIRVSRGELLTGLKDLEKAAENTSQPGIYYHLGMTHERLSHTEEALTAYAGGAVFDGDIGDLAYNAFMTLWRKDNRSDTAAELFLDREGDIIEQNFIDKVLAKKITRKAPNFELEDITSRNWIRLSDQKGAPVVLCFWAAWSKSSHLLLRELNTLADIYGRDVLFMTIATDEEFRPVAAYIKKFKLAFPVLVNDKTDVGYGVEGVPMLYVIDSKLNINFIHRGYRPDISEILSIELDALLNQ